MTSLARLSPYASYAITQRCAFPVSFQTLNNLSLAGNFVSARESFQVLLNVASFTVELNVGTILEKATFRLQLDVLLTSNRCETPVLADDDLLATRELVHGSSESLDGGGTVSVSGSDGQKDLTDIDTGDGSLWLSPSTSHSSLKSIGTSARQHLVDSDDVVGVGSDSHVETFFAGDLDQIFVGADTRSLEGFGTQLFVLIGNHVHAKREFVDIGTLSSEIEDSDLGVWDTTVESRLRVRFVLAVTVAASRSSGHFDGCDRSCTSCER